MPEPFAVFCGPRGADKAQKAPSCGIFCRGAGQFSFSLTAGSSLDVGSWLDVGSSLDGESPEEVPPGVPLDAEQEANRRLTESIRITSNKADLLKFFICFSLFP